MRKIVVSAPGKVILHGEHAVVHGKRALATCLDIRTVLTLDAVDCGKVQIDLPDIDVHKEWSTEEISQQLSRFPRGDVQHPFSASDEVITELRKLASIKDEDDTTRSMALITFLYLYTAIAATNSELPSVTVHVKSSLPPGAGLGSSAAYSTCLAASLLLLRGAIATPTTPYHQSDSSLNQVTPEADVEVAQAPSSLTWAEKQHLKLINDWAFEGEKIIHGRPSGIDNAISTYGGALGFQKGVITPMKSVPNLNILLTNTKVPRSTKQLVAKFRDNWEKHPDVLGPILNSFGAIVEECEQVLNKMDSTNQPECYQQLQELISINQNLLSTFGVSHPTIDDIVLHSRRFGLSSKLTGAGGGGCTLTLIPPGTDESTLSALQTELIAKGYECWRTSIGGAGVLYHTAG